MNRKEKTRKEIFGKQMAAAKTAAKTVCALLLLLTTAPATAQIQNIGVRTNLLSWAVASPALGVDVQWNRRWQATLDGHISLLSDDPDNGNARYLRMSGVGVEVRRYFQTEHYSTDIPRTMNEGLPFHGAYLALSARYLKFDHLLLTDTGREGIAYTAGATVGYTFFLPCRWTVDAAIGAGYVYKDYNRYKWYNPTHQNRLLGTKSTNSFGLTHAEVSLVYHFKL